jgi:retron-type reverse transcriptase
MSYQLQRFIEDQVKRTIRKYQLQTYRKKRDRAKLEKRTGKKAGKKKGVASNSLPRWSLDQQFNPFYVRKKLVSLSRTIEEAIKSKSYAPRPSLEVSVPKEGGGSRGISVYSVPDAAVGTWLHKRLQTRNGALLSDSAFGYRSDKNANDAIRHVADAVKMAPRLFVVEYDFAKFFDSIDHSYLLKVLKKHFQIRADEMAVLRALLTGSFGNAEDYKLKKVEQRSVGVPQGNTISLFLANAVCRELDKALEDLGVVFARYADDIVVVTKTYLKACSAANRILAWSAESKVKINHRKSDGISLLIPAGVGEIKSKNRIAFLGCELSKSGVCPAEKRILRLKIKIARVIYQHLVQAPKKRTFNKKRIQPEVDWDLVTCVNEIRKILYGRLTEADVTAGLAASEPLKPVRSHVSGFAMVDLSDRFRELDGWVVGVLERAYAMRSSLVAKLGASPLDLRRKSLISGVWYHFKKFEQETRMPSSFRIWLYIRKYYLSRGIRALPAPSYDY